MAEAFTIIVMLFSLAMGIYWFILAYRVAKALESIETSCKLIVRKIDDFLRSLPRE